MDTTLYRFVTVVDSVVFVIVVDVVFSCLPPIYKRASPSVRQSVCPTILQKCTFLVGGNKMTNDLICGNKLIMLS
jgi:hypothetical protein